MVCDGRPNIAIIIVLDRGPYIAIIMDYDRGLFLAIIVVADRDIVLLNIFSKIEGSTVGRAREVFFLARIIGRVRGLYMPH
jgi:hypothetical protein